MLTLMVGLGPSLLVHYRHVGVQPPLMHAIWQIIIIIHPRKVGCKFTRTDLIVVPLHLGVLEIKVAEINSFLSFHLNEEFDLSYWLFIDNYLVSEGI